MNWSKIKSAVGLMFVFALFQLSTYASDISQAIQQHRMGTLIIETQPGSRIQVEQLRHEFWFGSAISSSAFSGRLNPEDEKKYKEVFLANFNAAVTENALKWLSMERTRARSIIKS